MEIAEIDAYIARRTSAFGEHLSVSLTGRCPLKCSHCVVSSFPSSDRSLDLSQSAVDKIISDLPHLSDTIHQISFTGGEPFMRKDYMADISRVAHGLGMQCGAVTSAHWASKLEVAVKVLDSLPYLHSITISADVYHNEFVPFSWIQNAFLAAARTGRKASVRVSLPMRPSEKELAYLREVEAAFSPHCHTQQVVPFGRAADIDLDDIYTTNVPVLPCLSSGPHVSNSGNILPCCSALTDDVAADNPLRLGSMHQVSLTDAYALARGNWLLTFIRLWGFARLMEQLVVANPAKYGGKSFVEEGQCTLCAALALDTEAMAIADAWVHELDRRVEIGVAAADAFGDWTLLNSVLPLAIEEMSQTRAAQ